MLKLLKRIRDWWHSRRTRRISGEAVRERVQRGAAYLDEVDPGWHRRVDVETLELGDGQQCVLGQLHGEFRLGLGRSHLLTLSSAPRTSLSPVAYGFKCVNGVSDEWQARDYDLLTAAWRSAVRQRQQADAPPDDVVAGADTSISSESREPVVA